MVVRRRHGDRPRPNGQPADEPRDHRRRGRRPGRRPRGGRSRLADPRPAHADVTCRRTNDHRQRHPDRRGAGRDLRSLRQPQRTRWVDNHAGNADRAGHDRGGRLEDGQLERHRPDRSGWDRLAGGDRHLHQRRERLAGQRDSFPRAAGKPPTGDHVGRPDQRRRRANRDDQWAQLRRNAGHELSLLRRRRHQLGGAIRRRRIPRRQLERHEDHLHGPDTERARRNLACDARDHGHRVGKHVSRFVRTRLDQDHRLSLSAAALTGQEPPSRSAFATPLCGCWPTTDTRASGSSQADRRP